MVPLEPALAKASGTMTRDRSEPFLSSSDTVGRSVLFKIGSTDPPAKPEDD
jgi:hypothetical protein